MATEEDQGQKPEDQTRQTAEEFDVHRQLVFWLFVATAFIVALTVAALIGVDRGAEEFKKLSILPIVATAGALGAFVSALRRLYSFEQVFPSQRYGGLLKGASLYVMAYSSIPPLVGVVAAVVLYIVFAGNLLTGAAFPSFECELGEDRCTQFAEFLKHWKPASAQDYAKAIVWGFEDVRYEAF